MKPSKAEHVFKVFNMIILSCALLSTILPFLHIISKSLSSDSAVLAKEVVLWPVEVHMHSYKYVLNNRVFVRAFFNTVFVTCVGTSLSMLLTVLVAFPLTKDDMPFKNLIAVVYIITMFFQGGMIPSYLLYKQIGILDKLWVLILPSVVLPFYLILMRNFFESIPISLEESAKMDGASYFRILFQIIIPLSKAALATIGLFYAVAYWNRFMEAVLFISKREKITLQVYLRNLIISNEEFQEMDMDALKHVTQESTRAASIITSMIPILLIYPFAQKYFVKGVMIGAIKQ